MAGPIARLPPSRLRQRKLAGARQQAGRLVDRMAHDIERLPVPIVHALTPVLAQAERELEQGLQEWLSRTDGAKRFTTQEYRRALVQIKQALHTVKQTRPVLHRALVAQREPAARMSMGHLREQWQQFSLMFEGSIRPIALDEAAVMARGSRLLIPRFRASAKRYGAQVTDHIKRELAVGIVRAETIDQMASRLQRIKGRTLGANMLAQSRGWAERVARTEVMHAYSVTSNESIKELVDDDPEVRRQWDASLDFRVCLICRELDSQVRPVDKPFDSSRLGRVDLPPAHPHCFPAETRVKTSRGWVAIDQVRVGDMVFTHRNRWRRVSRLMSRRFTGKLVAVRHGEHVVRATPEHPFLTPRGWVEAQDLRVGSTQVYVPQSAATVADGPPSQIFEGQFLNGVLGESPLGRMPVAPVDLDGDFVFGEGQINVEPVDGQVRRDGDPYLCESHKERSLVSGLGRSLIRKSALSHVLGGAFGTANRVVSSLCHAANLLAGHSGEAAHVVLPDGSHHAPFVQHTSDGNATAIVAGGQRHRGFTTKVQGDNFVFGENPSSHTSTMPVHLDKTWKTNFDGLVYNFAVDEDESYVAEGFVVHNCRCVIVPWHKEWIGKAMPAGPKPKAPKPKAAKPKKPKRPATPLASLDARAKQLALVDQEARTLRARWPQPTPPQQQKIDAAESKATNLRSSMSDHDRALLVAQASAGARLSKGPAKGSAEDWTHVRQHLDGDMVARGYAPRRDAKRDVEIKRSRAWLGVHEWNGTIKLTPGTIEGAKRFGAEWAKDPKGTTARMRQGMRALKRVQTLETKANRLGGEAHLKRVKLASIGLSPQNVLTAQNQAYRAPETRVIPQGVNASQKKAIQDYWKTIDARAAATRARNAASQTAGKDPGVQTMKASHGFHTTIHEDFHGYGPTNAGDYKHSGRVVEEVTTETLARRDMIKRFGVPKNLYERGGSYGKWIDPLTDKVADLYGVNRIKARTIIEAAADKFKRIAPDKPLPPARTALQSVANINAAKARKTALEKFTDLFPPTGDPATDRPSGALVDRNGRNRNKLVYDLQNEIARLARMAP